MAIFHWDKFLLPSKKPSLSTIFPRKTKSELIHTAIFQ